MASTQASTTIYDNVTLTAAAADNTSSAVDLSTGYGGVLFVKITNGGTGPTIAAKVQIEGSPDNSNWHECGGAMVGSTGNSVVRSWSPPIPMGFSHLRLVAGSNTGQNVTVRAAVVNVTDLNA